MVDISSKMHLYNRDPLYHAIGMAICVAFYQQGFVQTHFVYRQSTHLGITCVLPRFCLVRQRGHERFEKFAQYNMRFV